MEEKFWNRFAETGKIADYLTYRGIAICEEVIRRHEGDTSGESDYSDGDGDRVSADWGI